MNHVKLSYSVPEKIAYILFPQVEEDRIARAQEVDRMDQTFSKLMRMAAIKEERITGVSLDNLVFGAGENFPYELALTTLREEWRRINGYLPGQVMERLEQKKRDENWYSMMSGLCNQERIILTAIKDWTFFDLYPALRPVFEDLGMPFADLDAFKAEQAAAKGGETFDPREGFGPMGVDFPEGKVEYPSFTPGTTIPESEIKHTEVKEEKPKKPRKPRTSKKAVAVEAFQMTEARRMDNSEWPSWLNEAWNKERGDAGSVTRVNMEAELPDLLAVNTPEGVDVVSWGDWIVRDEKGNLYSYTTENFVAKYGEIKVPSENSMEEV